MLFSLIYSILCSLQTNDRTASHRHLFKKTSQYYIHMVQIVTYTPQIKVHAYPRFYLGAFTVEPIGFFEFLTTTFTKIWYAFSLYIGVLCEPFLRGPITPVCKNDNENLTFTCNDSQVKVLQWEAEPHLFNNDALLFTSNNENGTTYSVDNFTAILTNKENVNVTLEIAYLSSTLTMPTSRIPNETVIICATSSAGISRQSSLKFTTAGTVIQSYKHFAWTYYI